MFNAKVLAVKNLMVVGKLLTLLAISSSSVYANDLNEPKFFEYRSGEFTNRLVDFTFGWFKTLDREQKEAYHSTIHHAVMMAENGQRVTWYKNDASGIAVPVMTWPNGNGYCRRVHIQAIAYGVEKTMAATACFDNAHTNWRWIRE
jgi:surface antigen